MRTGTRKTSTRVLVFIVAPELWRLLRSRKSLLDLGDDSGGSINREVTAVQREGGIDVSISRQDTAKGRLPVPDAYLYSTSSGRRYQTAAVMSRNPPLQRIFR